MKEKISVKIQSVENRRNMLIALAESGYMASVEEVYDSWMCKPEYYVVFEIENANKSCGLLKARDSMERRKTRGV